MDAYVTFLAGILRSVRFGAGDAHGKANMVRFHFFEQQGAFSRDPASGRYRVDFDKMQVAMNALSEKLLTIQGDGDFHHIWILDGGICGIHWVGGGGHVERGVGSHHGGKFINQCRVNERFVALDIDDVSRLGDGHCRLGDPVGACWVVG